MEQILKETLWPNEELLWMGRPSKSDLKAAPDRKMQIIKWAVMAVFLVLTLGILVPYMFKIGQSVGVLLISIIVINVMPVIIAFRPWLDQQLLENKTLCAVTDQRVISVVKDVIHELPRKDLEFMVSGREGSAGSIRFNGAIQVKKPNDRTDAVLGIPKEEERPKGMVFFHIDGVDQVLDLLSQPAKAVQS